MTRTGRQPGGIPGNAVWRTWGEKFPVWDLIRSILAEAFSRAGIALDAGFEWRAGCPVHANLDYRSALSQVLYDLTGRGNTGWVVEEPVLFLTLARRLGDLTDGAYMVYDIGGGSFDCALVEVKGNDMLVYGADGHPLMGGSDIDDRLERLAEEKGYRRQRDLIRQAKELLTESNPSETLQDGTVITLDDVEKVLEEGRFGEKSISTMRDAYVGAKVLWKRGKDEDDPPIGETLTLHRRTGEMQFVWQLMWGDMTKDIDKIILFGGPTKSPYFRRKLSRQFGEGMIIKGIIYLCTQGLPLVWPVLLGQPGLFLEPPHSLGLGL